jgi:hypothetical protein
MLLAVVLLGVSGCGGNRAAVEGTVTFDKEPVDGGMILFFPEKEAKTHKGRADIVNGSYRISSGDAPPPGKYRVEIVWYKKTGKQVVSKGDPPNMEDETIQVIPEKYNTKSILTADLKAGSNTENYALTKK